MAALVCFAAPSAPAAAQTAAPWLSADHWATRTATRLHALGLTPPGFDPVAREHDAAEIARTFRHAWLAATRAGRHLALVDAYLKRFAEERPATFARTIGVSRDSTYAHAEAALGVRERRGALLAGRFTADRQWVEPQARSDVTRPFAAVDLSAAWGDAIAATFRASADADDVRVEHASLDAAVGAIGIWAGRRSSGFAPTRAGGLVLQGDVAFEGGGLRLARPARLPIVGGTAGEMFVARVAANGLVQRPWLLGMRLHVQPHARIDAGATRAAVFGGLKDNHPGIRQLAEVLVAANLAGDFADDQVFSFDAHWRPALGTMPLELYGEWGIHDIDVDVFFDVPAFAIGARAASLPFAPTIDIAVEHTQIGGSCCGNPPWYHHFELANGWTENGVPLGHPLGGHGREWRIVSAATLLDARLQLEAQLFRRRRGEENLFAPTRAGRATGGELNVVARPTARFRLGFNAALEDGATWHARSVAAHIGVRF